MGPQLHLLAVVQPQQQYYPSQPFYPHDVPLQEVPNGHDMCPTGKTLTRASQLTESARQSYRAHPASLRTSNHLTPSRAALIGATVSSGHPVAQGQQLTPATILRHRKWMGFRIISATITVLLN